MITPKHVGFIMDGNGRWAQEQGRSRSTGHRAGFEHIPTVLKICYDLGVHIVSGFTWSTENWERPKPEVAFIMRSLERRLPAFVKDLHEGGIRFVHSGSRKRLTATALQVIDESVALTRNNGPWVFNFVFNYGGRAELLQATRRLLAEKTPPDAISEPTINNYLWTAGLPDIDLLIRTGGEQRISNFLLWQSAYACIYFTKTYWPALNREEIEAGIAYYNRVMAKG